MSRRIAVGIAAVVVGMSLIVTTPVQSAETYFGQPARQVAKEIGCKDFRQTGAGDYNQDAGICFLKGMRVNVITFRSRSKQLQWNAVASVGLPPDHYWANGRGAVVTAKDGNRAAAELGARLLPGNLKKP